MKSSLLRRSPMFVLATVALAACSAATAKSGFTTQGTGAGSSGGDGTGGGGITGLGNDGGTGAGVTAAYAHTNDTLFKLDPSQPNLALTEIGAFDCIGSGPGQDSSMTDLAVNDTGDLWGISAHDVFKLELPSGGTGTVHCASKYPIVSSQATFYGLTFAPVNVIDPSKEVLVAGNTAGELWAIDTSSQTAALTQHGTFGTVPANDGHGHAYLHPGTTWQLSGDIVFLANNGSPVGFATVRDCSSSSCNTTDTLVELDLTAVGMAGTQPVIKSLRGQIVKSTGCNDSNAAYGGMYGIAAFQDKVYGFSHTGFIVTIDNNDGTACLALATPNDDWAGAAITTSAQVVPPTQ